VESTGSNIANLILLINKNKIHKQILIIMYHKNSLSKLNNIAEKAPTAMQAFLAFDKAAMAQGVLDIKTKELIALAVAHTTQCIYCIDLHNANARKNGATDQEIAETILVAAALRAGGAVAHGTHCF
jgi:AhpD family alkylhydroperoxidase